MSDRTFAELARRHTLRGLAVPRIVRELAVGREPELAWRNDLDGLTFRIGDRYLDPGPRPR